jgi:hypothetical protein
MSDRTSTLTTGQKPQLNPEVGPCLVELLDRCGIAAAHFASRGTADLKGLLSQQPQRIATLTVLCPAVLDTRTLARIGERLLVVTGDRGPGARRVQAGLPDLPRATAVVLDDYAGLTWSDIAAERGDGSSRRSEDSFPVTALRHRSGCPSRKAKSAASPIAFAAPACRWCCCRSIYRPGNGSR